MIKKQLRVLVFIVSILLAVLVLILFISIRNRSIEDRNFAAIESLMTDTFSRARELYPQSTMVRECYKLNRKYEKGPTYCSVLITVKSDLKSVEESRAKIAEFTILIRGEERIPERQCIWSSFKNSATSFDQQYECGNESSTIRY